MAARSIASLSLSFGLVSIPVRLYSATSASESISFNLLAPDGSRVQQQYVSKATGKVVERAEMQKGYEFEKDKFVVFTKDELKALEESPSHIVEILAFLPDRSIDPVYYDKAYFVAPDKRGGKPYCLLKKALLASKRCALASWNWKAKTHMVQVRATDDGLILQQLLWGDAVRSLKDLDIEDAPVTDNELQLALKIIEQGETESYEPDQYEDKEKKRVLEAIDAKIEGKQIVTPHEDVAADSGQVIDLTEALRASLARNMKRTPSPARTKPAAPVAELPAKPRKTVKRAEKVAEPVTAPARTRARR